MTTAARGQNLRAASFLGPPETISIASRTFVFFFAFEANHAKIEKRNTGTSPAVLGPELPDTWLCEWVWGQVWKWVRGVQGGLGGRAGEGSSGGVDLGAYPVGVSNAWVQGGAGVGGEPGVGVAGGSGGSSPRTPCLQF